MDDFPADVTAKEKEKDLAHKVVHITQGKFRSLVQILNKGDNRYTIQRAIRAMEADDAFQSEVRGKEFETWVKILPDVVAIPPDAELGRLIPYASGLRKRNVSIQRILSDYLT